MTETKPERIAKRIARAGLCSRREAERWIEAGRIAVDGKTLDSPALNVAAGAIITVDGTPIPEAEATRAWRFHKPTGCLTTNKDPQGRKTIFEFLPEGIPRVVTVGRLDYNSEGLLLLTNDGDVARRLEHPDTAWRRRYRVRVHGCVDEDRLVSLARGITIDGIKYGPIEAVLEREQRSNAWLVMSLSEGKNREVRRICEHLGLQVTRLIRISYGPFQLGNMPSGACEAVPSKALAEQLGGGGKGRRQRANYRR
ncbi:MAG: pseudouridine synthase [Candidatus Latescibacterota bacterium]